MTQKSTDYLYFLFGILHFAHDPTRDLTSFYTYTFKMANSDDGFDSTTKFCTRCRTNRRISIFRGKRKKMVKDCATYLQTTTTAGGVASGAVSAAPGPATPDPATVASIEPTRKVLRFFPHR